jgi:hypothetical protein
MDKLHDSTGYYSCCCKWLESCALRNGQQEDDHIGPSAGNGGW